VLENRGLLQQSLFIHAEQCLAKVSEASSFAAQDLGRIATTCSAVFVACCSSGVISSWRCPLMVSMRVSVSTEICTGTCRLGN